MDKYHRQEYILLRNRHNWPQTLPSENKERTTLATDGPREKFTLATFQQYLVNFITSDDQVGADCRLIDDPLTIFHQSINVVESPYFRRLLLLLRESLQEKDIPHRTKMRELIMESWEAYIETLKEELAVRHYYLPYR